MTRETVLECRHLHHWFGRKKVLVDVNLKVLRGEIVSLVGPSGCGKSTLLRAIVGTHPPRKGEVIMHSLKTGRTSVVCNPGRDRGIVYQNYSLFAFQTACENAAMGLMLDQTSIPFRLFHYLRWRKLRKQHLRQATELLEKLNLKDAVNLYPHEMSGGMRQRVAIAQALIMKPEILLLDEPFGALDEATREELQRMLLVLYRENREAKIRGESPPYTIMIVTHELNEAIYVGDRVVGLSQYWDWESEGFQESPGATIVYDKPAPVYKPDQDRNFEVFLKQRKTIRRTTFSPEVLQSRHEHVTFWKDLEDGKGQGILK